MNATKKVSSILLLGAGVTMLAACGGKSLTRAESESVLDAMKPTASTLVTNVTKTGTSEVDRYVSSDGSTTFYAHVKVTGSSTYKDSNSSTVTVKGGTEMWALKDGTNYIVASTDGTNSYYYSGTDAIVKTAVEAAVTAKLAGLNKTMTGSPAYISSYLKKFDNLTNASAYKTVDGSGVAIDVTAGASEKGSVLGIKDENYKSTGAGYLDAKFTAVYPKETPANEPLEYVYNDSRLTKTYNGKSGTTVTYDWAKCDTDKSYKTSWSSYTLGTLGAAADAAVLALI